ncbi:type II toxin-antitoxin system VapC family toxin [Truepera radiovictrix]|uniref:PilT protein domain protein n=1 Tax=Truepera radiovictrix (strain DSM 17093 / CIP 108686 / LMG 22925 / RQ-24) TaxID=649638 RepID=D7CQB2_TRURR|nr:type II toxin-antitoxin system VapC family toxin [Truepera radiovictrix]ADI14896.1 PilT protein domain protein [Truepera radiovictrix DSM 17093]WMT56552.1 type II toxin-antitoxin system VapC family toxin [Truepera radiovictrix]
MKLLLDTHVLIWVFDGSADLATTAKEVIADGRNEVFVSAVTAWEIAIKRSLGKLELRGDYQRGLTLYRFTPLAISTEHALATETLPPHHADPFDRLLIAQATLEGLTIISRDARFADYGVELIKA